MWKQKKANEQSQILCYEEKSKEGEKKKKWKDKIEILKNIISLLCKLIREMFLSANETFNDSRGENWLKNIAAAWDVQ